MHACARNTRKVNCPMGCPMNCPIFVLWMSSNVLWSGWSGSRRASQTGSQGDQHTRRRDTIPTLMATMCFAELLRSASRLTMPSPRSITWGAAMEREKPKQSGLQTACLREWQSRIEGHKQAKEK